MSHYQDAPELKGALLGQQTEYKDTYDANLLFAIPRKLNRDGLNIDESALPFLGEDTWTGYELSWLNAKGKPQVAVGEFVFPCQSSHLIESKSFKLYLNSFNQTRFDSVEQVHHHLERDLSDAANCQVKVTLYTPEQFDCLMPTALPGTCIDELDIEVNEYEFSVEHLKLGPSNAQVTDEILYSHLLKSNCLITSQPDWASIIIRYSGTAICHESILRYLISFRNHNEFHEQCVERIFHDLQGLGISELDVYARYTRRGGLDINPFRSTRLTSTPFSVKTNRQ